MLGTELKPSDATDARGGPLLLFSNPDCRVLLSPARRTNAFFVRYVDGDLLSFVHRGAGLAGDRVRADALPRGRLDLPAEGEDVAPGARRRETTLLMIEATDEFRVRRPGTLGRHFPFDPTQADHPGAGTPRRRRARRVGGRAGPRRWPTSLYYQQNPIDVEGWRGDNFPFTFNIADYNVVTSESVHLPPTVHLFMQATGVYVMNFLPKPAESVPGTERTPWYHRNVDYDEIAFFHGGSLYGIPMPPGLISHAPQGVHHGAPEKARERARRKFDDYDRVDWKVIAIDTRRRLMPSAEVLATIWGSTDDHRPKRPSSTSTTASRIWLPTRTIRRVRDVYGGVAELVVLESYLLKPKTKPSDTVLVFMHPIGGGAYLPMINALARAGHHVIYCNSRFRGTDSALLMEKVVEDLGECIKDAKNRLGYEKVVLAGWSGGGSLSVFYQQQAQHPTVTAARPATAPT